MSRVRWTSAIVSWNGETWQTISNRTGVSVADLVAANPGMKDPKGKVFVPVSGNKVETIAYTRPSTPAVRWEPPRLNAICGPLKNGDARMAPGCRNQCDIQVSLNM